MSSVGFGTFGTFGTVVDSWEEIWSGEQEDMLQYANEDNAVASTLAPRAASSMVVHSAGLWERPSRLGTKSMAVGRWRAMI